MKEKQLTLFAATPVKKTSTHPPLEPTKPAVDSVRLTVFIDGAARGNPGPAGAGIFITTQDKKATLKKGYHLRKKTNNQAEYLALVLALIHVQKIVEDKNVTHVTIHSDSELLVKQIQGVYSVKNPALKVLHGVARKLLEPLRYSISHVERALNEEADSLANMGIDRKAKIPQAMTNILLAHGITID